MSHEHEKSTEIGIAVENIPVGSIVERDSHGLLRVERTKDPLSVETLESYLGLGTIKDGTISFIHIQPKPNKVLYEIRAKLLGNWFTLRLVHTNLNLGKETFNYYINNQETTCQGMADKLSLLMPTLECLPLSIIDGPFRELDEILRRDQSTSEDRFSDLELDDEQEDSDRTGQSTNSEHQEG